MNKNSLWLASMTLAAAAVSQHSLAAPTTVSLAGEYSLAALPVASGQLKVSFDLPATAPSYSDDYSFEFNNVAATLEFDGIAQGYGSNKVAWFTFGGPQGLDFRFFGVFASNDYLQIIAYTPSPMFAGPYSNPTLNTTSFSELYAGVYYMPNLSSGGSPAIGSLYPASYVASSPVPENSPTMLLLLGLPALLALGMKRRHRSAQPEAVTA